MRQKGLLGVRLDDAGGEGAPGIAGRHLAVEAVRDGFVEVYRFALLHL